MALADAGTHARASMVFAESPSRVRISPAARRRHEEQVRSRAAGGAKWASKISIRSLATRLSWLNSEALWTSTPDGNRWQWRRRRPASSLGGTAVADTQRRAATMSSSRLLVLTTDTGSSLGADSAPASVSTFMSVWFGSDQRGAASRRRDAGDIQRTFPRAGGISMAEQQHRAQLPDRAADVRGFRPRRHSASVSLREERTRARPCRCRRPCRPS